MTAHCVITRSRPDAMPICHVHAYPQVEGACPGAGREAVTDPLHRDLRHGRIPAVADWTTRTDRQRPLLIHNGNLECVAPPHGDVDCWCRPETIPAGGNA